tara:strand:- start:1306 stop:1767 length:462 start_codon:yes stop_codon:yes gene_type:complete
MAKFHPASGKWGILGETAGSKQARDNLNQINQMISDINARRQNITSYYRSLSDMQMEDIESSTLSDLDKFLDESYNINMESDERRDRVGFANILTGDESERMKKLRENQEELIEGSKRRLEMSALDLGRREQTELFGIDDLLRNLELTRRDYS